MVALTRTGFSKVFWQVQGVSHSQKADSTAYPQCKAVLIALSADQRPPYCIDLSLMVDFHTTAG